MLFSGAVEEKEVDMLTLRAMFCIWGIDAAVWKDK